MTLEARKNENTELGDTERQVTNLQESTGCQTRLRMLLNPSYQSDAAEAFELMAHDWENAEHTD